MKQRIKDGIEGLLENPPLGDIKQLQGINPINYRLRIGKYRVIYEYIGNNQNVLYIKDVGSRGDIYKQGDDTVEQIARKVENMVDMLPEQEQLLAYELVKRMVLAWDSDFTKLTQSEREALEISDEDFINNETIKHEDVWKQKEKCKMA